MVIAQLLKPRSGRLSRRRNRENRYRERRRESRHRVLGWRAVGGSTRESTLALRLLEHLDARRASHGGGTVA